MEEELFQEEDITKTGPVGLKGLKGINQQSKEEAQEPVPFHKLMEQMYSTYGRTGTLLAFPNQAVEDITQDLLQQGFGESRFDKRLKNEADLAQGLSNFRAQELSALGQVANGLAKGVVLAGTTFLDGTVGLINGAVTKISTGEEGSFWNNDFSRTLKEINDTSEKMFPNYYSAYEQEAPWYNNIFTANFLGDKFIKNLGFTIGAYYSGGVVTKGLKLTKFPQLMGAITKSSKAPAMVNAGIGATISAVNEGRVEALNNSTDWFNLNKLKLDDKYMNLLLGLQGLYGNSPEYLNYATLAEQSYNEELAKLSEDLAKMGNADLLMNLPILLASNLFEFGKLYANGFKTARRTTNIAKTGAEYGLERNALGGWVKGVGNAFSEGSEEMLQKAASLAAGNYYNSDIENFYRAKIDPEASQQTLDWTKAMALAINETVNDTSSWEEFTIGALTGALGMPTFGKANTQNAYLGKGRAFGLTGGLAGEVKDYNEETERQQAIVDYLNGRLSSPGFKNYYQGLTRHQKYQTLMDAATIKDDAFNFKNAEHALLVSDIMMFANAGRLEDLVTLVNSAFDTSDGNLESIAKNTTTTNQDGEVIGPFVDSKGNPLYATEAGKKQMVEQLTKSKDEILDTINQYNEAINTLDSQTGEALTDEQLEELAWIKLQNNNWQTRATEMTGEVKSAVGRVIGVLELGKRDLQNVMNVEGQKSADLTDEYKSAEKELKKVNEWISALDFVRNIPNDGMLSFLKQRPGFTKEITTLINTLNADENLIDIETANTIDTLFEDLNKIRKGSEIYDKKLKEYLDNPSKIDEIHRQEEEKIVTEETNKAKQSLRDNIQNAKSVSDVRNIVRNTDQPELMASVLDEVANEGNDLVKQYRETGRYYSEVQNRIKAQDIPLSVKEDAMKLMGSQYSNSQTLEEISNSEGFYINDDQAFLEDEGGDTDAASKRFENARYALQLAMDAVNKSDKFKNRFATAEKAPEKAAAPAATVSSSETGNDSTPTVPTANASRGTRPVSEMPIGDSSFEDIAKENESASPNNQSYFEKGEKRFYIPAVPQLDIDSLKAGKMIPFDDAKRQQGMNFDAIYKYLNDSGAFTYVNKGLLKVGDTVEFMIDPSFNNHTIFMVTKKGNGEYQVIGSLQESDYKVKEFVGLPSLQKEILDAYASKGGTQAKFYYDGKTTKVALILTGKIPYVNTENNLASIPGVLDADGKALKFGIMKNGSLIAPGIDASNIVYPVTIKREMEGRLYMFVKNSAGKYSPAAVRVKHFNEKEFNVFSSTNTDSSTAIGKDIRVAIDKMAQALFLNDESLLREGAEELSKLIYLQDVLFNFGNGLKGLRLDITKVNRDSNGNPIMVKDANGQEVESKTNLPSVYATDFNGNANSQETLFSQIYNLIQSLNLPLQVSVKLINSKGYNERLINSGILTSNISEATTLNSFFITDYFDNSVLLTANKIPSVEVKPTSTTPAGGKPSVINGTKIRSIFSNKTYYVDMTNRTIKDENGNNIKITADNQILFDIAWALESFGDSMDAPSVMTGGKVITPSGKILDRINQKYLSGAAEVAVKEKLLGETIKNKDYSQASISVPAIFKPNDGLKAQDDVTVNDVNYEGLIGFYETGDGVFRGKLRLLGNIQGVDMYYLKLPGTPKDDTIAMGDQLKDIEIPTNTYYAVFPNGTAIPIVRDLDSRTADDVVTSKMIEALKGNPDRFKNLATMETIVTTTKSSEEVKPAPSQTVQQAQAGQDLLKDMQDEDDEYMYGEDNVQVTLREAKSVQYKVWDLKKELAWLDKVLPQLSQQDRVRVAKGLIKVGNQGTTAWGMLDKGIVTLSDIAAEGTAYHEAFHVVFNLLLSQQERDVLYKEARQKFGDKSLIDLEEDMAEGFREYVMSRDSRSWGQKILDFFKDLYAKVTNWKDLQPSLTAYYRAINGGKYVKNTLSGSTASMLRAEEYTPEMQSIKEKAITDGTFMKAPNGNPTNLTERQWLQVRTKAFKDWFGDWENNGIVVSKDNRTDKYLIYKDGNKIGDFLIDEKRGIIYYVELDSDFREKGLGKYTYVAANRELNKNGITLKSRPNPEDGNPLHPNAEKIWQNLIKEGLAKKTEYGYDMIADSTTSKVVDENGEPLVVYHGSPNGEIEIFDASKGIRKAIGSLSSEISDKMNFFTDDDVVANAYAVDYNERNNPIAGGMYDLFLNIKNPKVIDYNGANWNGKSYKAQYFDPLDDEWADLKAGDEENLNYFADESDVIRAARKKLTWLKGKEITDKDLKITQSNELQETNKQVENAFNLKRYDGVIIKNVVEVGQGSSMGSIIANDYITFNSSNQIKSATDNNGEFSRTNNDIRYRLTTTSFDSVDSEVKETLIKQGWTEDRWNSISEDERLHAIKCYGI